MTPTRPPRNFRLYRRRRSTLAVVLAFLVTAAATGTGVQASTPDFRTTATDSLYRANHPRLLFDAGDIPALYAKVRDGGYDDDAYSFIRLLVDYIYPGDTEAEILGEDFGCTAVPMLGLATYLESPEDESARSMGLQVVLYLVDQYEPDDNDYESALRLRSLALGYDLFMDNATEPQRSLVRDEIVAYVDRMNTGFAYQLRGHRPYMSNKSAMVAAALGLGVLALDGELDPEYVASTLDRADYLIDLWSGYLIDADGAYAEGVLYAAWSMKNLVYYFAARKRYDGTEYDTGKIRRLENWFAYELLPEGDGKTNNLNDSTHGDDPLPRHHTYFDWAQYEWQSGLSAWLFEHVAGTHGWDWGKKADKPATVLWNTNPAPQQPDSVLPASFVWQERGLYYTRTGWPSGESSGDLLFSFFSGRFRGGHAQEDQNQFTLYAYGARFAIDHGPGTVAVNSAAHNIVFIDGAGQHNAGNSIGTDGEITRHVLDGFADVVRGDATAAYTTYSPLNNPKYPFPFSDWSWGYSGSNPVEHAIRDVVAVHGGASLPPYFLIVDDILKDGGTHNFQWRMHTADPNTVDTSGDDTRIDAPGARMIIHALNPEPQSMTRTVTPFNNQTEEPDSKLLVFEVNAVNPRFAFLLLPGDGSSPVPDVTRQEFAWGVQATISWGAATDIVVLNHSGGPVDVTVSGIPTPPAGGANGSPATSTSLQTDAGIAVLRWEGGSVRSWLATEAQALVVNGFQLMIVTDGPATVVHSGTTVGLDRVDADFTLYGPEVTGIHYRSQQVYFVENGGYLAPDPVVGAGAEPVPPPRFRARAHPNPFNPSTTVVFELGSKSRVRAVAYDPLGRPVRVVADTVFPAGSNEIRWDGKDDAGRRVPSGVYLLRLSCETGTATVKLTVLK